MANPGWVRPPLAFLVAIAAGIVAEEVYPAPLPARTVLLISGAFCFICGILLFISSKRTMDKAGTPLPGNKPTMALVQSGPFRFSRNPIYLAFVLLHLGIALAYSSTWLLLTLVAAACLIDLVVIRREERYLAASFGNSYLNYKASVRRWI